MTSVPIGATLRESCDARPPSRRRSRRRPRSGAGAGVGAAAAVACLSLVLTASSGPCASAEEEAPAAAGVRVLSSAAAAAQNSTSVPHVTFARDDPQWQSSRNLRRRAAANAAADDSDGSDSGEPPYPPPVDELFSGPNVDASHFGPSLRIIGGTPSPLNSHPYMVTLKRQNRGRADQHFCAATVIAKNVLLTAAHCKGGWTYAEVGRWDLNDGWETRPGGSSRGVKAKRMERDYELSHPDHKGGGMVLDNPHDIMLIKLKSDVPEEIYSPVVLDLQLRESTKRPPLVEDDPLLVSGWGVAKYRRNPNTQQWQAIPSPTLLDATVYLVPNDQCAKSEGLGYSYAGAIDDSMLCARADGRDACQGDSGGPLILHPDDNKWKAYKFGIDRSQIGAAAGEVPPHIQVGVVSFGIGCAIKEFPGVYSRISAQAKWLADNVCAMTKKDAPPWFNCNGELDNVVGKVDIQEEPIRRTPVPTPAPVAIRVRRRKRYRRSFDTAGADTFGAAGANFDGAEPEPEGDPIEAGGLGDGDANQDAAVAPLLFDYDDNAGDYAPTEPENGDTRVVPNPARDARDRLTVPGSRHHIPRHGGATAEGKVQAHDGRGGGEEDELHRRRLDRFGSSPLLEEDPT